MTKTKIAERVFEHRDQELFASLSGDVNPLHMDDLAARRTQAGSQVVHGVHAFLWAVEKWLVFDTAKRTIKSAKASFNKFLLLGRPVTVLLAKQTDTLVKLGLTCDGLEVMTVTLKFGERNLPNDTLDFHSLSDKPTASSPDVRSFDEMADVSGWLVPPVGVSEIGNAFPICCEGLSPERVAAIAQLSTLVGMHNPGLYSVFSSFSIDLVQAPDNAAGDRTGIGFKTSHVDERFRMVVLSVAGRGLQVTVETFARQEPVLAPTISKVSERVNSQEFAGVVALIVGGSRGLGAATAKLIAAGGGKCVITYARGRRDADQIAEELNAARGTGTCRTMSYDARKPADSQIESIDWPITDVHYFATPQIFRQKTGFCEAELFDFVSVYVTGFHDLCRSMLSTHADSMRNIFYPSSVAIDDRPKGMLEYAMAKAAGEMMCAEIDQASDRVTVHKSRIPRTTTDQTATVSPVESADPIDVMLPILRKMAIT